MVAPTQCFAIFEGGGAKGITHLGALQALEDVGLETVGVAGTSAGAIIAALTAVGFKANKLFDPIARTDILSDRQLGPVDLLGRNDWGLFKRMRMRAALGAFAYIMPLFVSFDVFALSRLCGRPRIFIGLWRLFDGWGFFSTENARDLMNDLLREKLALDTSLPAPAFVRFKDIDPLSRRYCCRLKIIATNTSRGSLEVFDVNNGNVVVADAVAASFSIPLFFKPTQIRTIDDHGHIEVLPDTYADGGLISNLPVWAFFEEKRIIERDRANCDNPPIPIVAFTLDSGATANESGPKSLFDGLIGHVTQILKTGIFGGQSLVQTLVPNLTVISLPTDLEVLDFDCGRDAAIAAFVKGRDKAVERMKSDFRVLPVESRQALLDLIAKVRASSDALRPLQKVGQFRASLIAPEGRYSFKIVATANMDHDADDILLLDRKNPGAPTAYDKRTIVALDLSIPTFALWMTKYERALVRPTLESIVCIPIFADVGQWALNPQARAVPIGVLCIDSDDRLDVELKSPSFRQMLQVESVRFWTPMSSARSSHG